MTPRLLKLKDAAKYLATSLLTLRGIIERGELPVIKGSGETSPFRVDMKDLDRWIDTHKEISE